MASSVKTVRIVDKRIEPQPDPVYAVAVGPQQNQFYKIPASGLSDSYLTFNNLTTLGSDRAYSDTFELEIKATVTFHLSPDHAVIMPDDPEVNRFCPLDEWTLDSFPFNKCCEEIRVNVNGGAFFSSPLSYLRAKERYWDDRKINAAYSSVCPCNKPWLANELAATNTPNRSDKDTFDRSPSRLSDKNYGYMCTADGPNGTTNRDMVTPYGAMSATETFTPYDRVVHLTWREPVFCSPFSSKYDQTYGRPLYNITSLDLAFNMQDLTNMIRVRNKFVDSYEVHLDHVDLCYQVMTIPAGISPPPSTVVPYRRFVPYITDYPQNPVPYAPITDPNHDQEGYKISVTSGVYTLNEVPTAIWIFLAPTKALLQQNPHDGWSINMWGGIYNETRTWTFNKVFAQMDHISISCANTTQILNTATPYDLYRIAKANGCQDTFTQWGRQTYSITSNHGDWVNPCGSVLRLIPGTDIVLPDQPLIPGSNANNMVFQVTGDFYVPAGFPPNYRNVSLWVLFEYVGVATITPGQCQIVMNPLNTANINPVATITPTQVEEPSTTEGGSWLEKLKSIGSVINKVAKDTKIASQLANFIPGVGPIVSKGLNMLGYGKMGKKRAYEDPSLSGGAVMGYGDFC